MSEILSNTGVKLWGLEDYGELWLSVFEELTGTGGASNMRLLDEAIGELNSRIGEYYFTYENNRLYACKNNESGTEKIPVTLVDSTSGYTASSVDGTSITIDENGVIHGATVDSAFSSTSENAIQNKVVKVKFDEVDNAIQANNDSITSLSDNKVDKVTGKGLSTNDYTTEEKTKLSGIETGANKTVVDSALSSSSTNPVQNKIVNTALGDKVDKINGKGLSTNDYTNAEKDKLESLDNEVLNKLGESSEGTLTYNGSEIKTNTDVVFDTLADAQAAVAAGQVEEGASIYIKEDSEGIVVDTVLSKESSNAIQNRAVAEKFEEVDTRVTELKKSVSDGKSLVAGAITEKGIETAADASFSVMAENIGNISSGYANGTEWTQSNLTSGRFNKIYNKDGIWVAFDETSKILYYSTDGKTWIQIDTISSYLNDIYYANGTWIAYGENLYYSEDGKVWSDCIISVSNHFEFTDVYNANGIWVISAAQTGLYYSEDGKNWTQGNITNIGFNCVYNANGIWVAGSSYNYGLYYSEDGKNWIQSNITTGYFASVYYANGIWTATVDDSNNDTFGIFYSTDGKTWTQSNITSDSYWDIYYKNGIWIAGNKYRETGIYYSTNGKMWEQSNITSDALNSIYYANRIWVAALKNNGLCYSTDGKTWTQSNNIKRLTNCVYYANGLWVAGGSNIYYSTNGKTWNDSKTKVSSVCTICYANGIWVAGTDSGSKGIYYSIGYEYS